MDICHSILDKAVPSIGNAIHDEIKKVLKDTPMNESNAADLMTMSVFMTQYIFSYLATDGMVSVTHALNQCTNGILDDLFGDGTLATSYRKMIDDLLSPAIDKYKSFHKKDVEANVH